MPYKNLQYKIIKFNKSPTLGGPLYVTLSDIYMVRMENDVVIPTKPMFSRRFVDGIYSRWKLGHDNLFDRLNN